MGSLDSPDRLERGPPASSLSLLYYFSTSTTCFFISTTIYFLAKDRVFHHRCINGQTVWVTELDPDLTSKLSAFRVAGSELPAKPASHPFLSPPVFPTIHWNALPQTDVVPSPEILCYT